MPGETFQLTEAGFLRRKKEVFDNPATVSSYFFLRRLITREIVSQFNCPTHFVKWFFAKYEDQFRGSVHVHELKKEVFMFLKEEMRWDADARGERYQDRPDAEKTVDDFEQIDIDVPKLSLYSSSRKLGCILVQQLHDRANALANMPECRDKRDVLLTIVETIGKSDAYKHALKTDTAYCTLLIIQSKLQK